MNFFNFWSYNASEKNHRGVGTDLFLPRNGEDNGDIRTKIKEALSPWLGLEQLVKKTKLRGPKLNELRVRIFNLNSFHFGPANLMFLSVKSS